jgi:hypothetical protein
MTQHDNILFVPVRDDDEIESFEFYRVNNESIMFSIVYKKHKLTAKTSWRIDTYSGDLNEYKWPWKFIGTTDTMGDKEWGEVVSKEFDTYRDYTQAEELGSYTLESPTASGHSLLQSLNITQTCVVLKNEKV